jgi:hypothetical protein
MRSPKVPDHSRKIKQTAKNGRAIPVEKILATADHAVSHVRRLIKLASQTI